MSAKYNYHISDHIYYIHIQLHIIEHFRLNESDRMVVFRLGKMQGVRGPGGNSLNDNFDFKKITLIIDRASPHLSMAGQIQEGQHTGAL